MINKELIKKYVEEHHAKYRIKYCFHSLYQSGENTFKVRYYTYDDAFRQIDIFIHLSITDKIEYSFSANLYKEEQEYIIKDVLVRGLKMLEYPSTLHYSLYEGYMKNISSKHIILEPIDYIHVLWYSKYRKGVPDSMDTFYDMFIPCMELLIENRNYKRALDSINTLLDMIVYDHIWEGNNARYNDTEYHYHLYYLKKLVKLIYSHLDDFYKHSPEELEQFYVIMFRNLRFGFSCMTELSSAALNEAEITSDLFNKMKEKYILTKSDDYDENENLIFSYLYYQFMKDKEEYYEVLIKVLRIIEVNILTYANNDLDVAIGNYIISKEGHGIILDLFERDFNSFVFKCFPIDAFPEEYKEIIKQKLIYALEYFAKRMENDKYRVSSFEQVRNINRILMDYYREEFYR